MHFVISLSLTVIAGFQLGIGAGITFFVVTFIGNQLQAKSVLQKAENGEELGSPWPRQIVTWVVAWIVAAMVAGAITTGQA
jgi:hypothetical protein